MGTKTHEFYLAKNHSRNYEDTTAHMNCIIRNQCPNVQNNDSDCPNFTTRQERCPSTSRSIASSMTGYTLHSCRHGVLETWWMRCRWALCGDADIKQRPKAQKQVSQQKKNGQKGDYLMRLYIASSSALLLNPAVQGADAQGQLRPRYHGSGLGAGVPVGLWRAACRCCMGAPLELCGRQAAAAAEEGRGRRQPPLPRLQQDGDRNRKASEGMEQGESTAKRWR